MAWLSARRRPTKFTSRAWASRPGDVEAVRQAYSELRLYTYVTMMENIALYTRLGWAETHRGEQDGYERVFMRKPCVVE